MADPNASCSLPLITDFVFIARLAGKGVLFRTRSRGLKEGSL
jgi:hypothetical protein